MNLVQHIITGYKNHQKQKFNARYAFVYKHTFNWFYSLYKQDIPKNTVDLADFYYKNEALDKAKLSTERFMAYTVASGNLNRRYARILGI